ncbi:MAG: hypothetical protein ABIN97_04935 [Ginsengibacter sp.]
MEKKFYTNDFEHLLKENADQFKMFPSKKVWHGIYNDIHPGTRWPSIAMSLLFVFTLVLIGHLNTQQGQHSYLPNVPKNVESKKPLDKNGNKETTAKSVNSSIEKDATLNAIAIPSHSLLIKEQLKGRSNQVSIRENFVEASNDIIYSSKEKNPDGRALSNSERNNEDLIVNRSSADLQNINTLIFDELNITAIEYTTGLTTDNISPSTIFSKPADYNYESIANNITDISNPGLKENKINVPTRTKIHKNPKITWGYYLAPSFSYRTYSNKGNDADQIYLGYINNSNSAGVNRPVTHRPTAGLEVGTAMKYSLTKKLKFTAGFQANYSSYTIQANNIHPIIATLILHDEKTAMPYAISAISYFGNGPGTIPVNLYNYSVQLSVPVGFEYQLAGNDRIQFSAAASFQPSLVLANQAYILSTDKRNYLTQSTLSRHWNMSTNVGTYISFASNKFKWQIGPQVHYQLLSAYANKYSVREHFIDYGIRVGVSKLIR